LKSDSSADKKGEISRS